MTDEQPGDDARASFTSLPTSEQPELTPALPKVDGERLIWPCSECREPIADRTGYLAVNVRSADERHAKVDAWRAASRSSIPLPSGDSAAVYSINELAGMPDAVAWYAFHESCDPNPESGDYWFAIERIRTLVTLIRWTAHLEDKQWLEDTSWRQILRHVGAQSGNP